MNNQTVVLKVRDLSVDFYVENNWVRAVHEISYDVKRGKVLGIVGESGSGKSQSSMSLIGLLPRNGIGTGKAYFYDEFGETELIDAPKNVLRNIRGKQIATIFQEPMTALNPVLTIGFQIEETLFAHTPISPKDAKKRALELLNLVQIPDPETTLNKYPHQLSGGQRQRVMIAQALALNPKILIADEPTTALDVTVQAEILQLMKDLKDKVDAGIILITHDMGVIADMADDIIVMRNGEIVESGTPDQIFYHPQHPYTQELLAAVPKLSVSENHEIKQHETIQTDLVFDAEHLVLEYQNRGKKFQAINDFNLHIHQGEVVGLVGESGSGKTTVGRATVGLLPVKSGRLVVNGIDVASHDPKSLFELRKNVSIIFQDPGSSLNPRLTIGDSIGEPVFIQQKVINKDPKLIEEAKLAGIPLDKKELSQYVEELLKSVELPTSYLNRYPHELSGGQRQRVGIARAIALKPKLLVADEPTSALDVSVQAKVLDLFLELQNRYQFACLFISHDLAVIEQVSSKIVVLSHGDIVEAGSASQILFDPQQEYTKNLIAAVPIADPNIQKARTLKN